MNWFKRYKTDIISILTILIILIITGYINYIYLVKLGYQPLINYLWR
jgi:hypothetical protein